ncbi:DUF5947 family protein [Kitasatospora sp. NPDC052896]|uniref:DUF5947 family protein n=1 Tax=Kitasatospora sp. NPDC052896 TaxID=3364061 RepID=UPI0037CB2ED6
MSAAGPGLALLRRLSEPAPPAPERCELCRQAVAAEHRHLVDGEARALVCACPGCVLLFEAGGGRYRAVPERYLVDPAMELDESGWQALQIPVGTAFFLRDTALDRLVALYPSPAGATESELDPAAWQAVLGGTRLAAELRPDVEALLLRRSRDGSTDCYLVPVDRCYELVGRMRRHWQGFDGGAEARAELAGFFTEVAGRARELAREVAP